MFKAMSFRSAASRCRTNVILFFITAISVIGCGNEKSNDPSPNPAFPSFYPSGPAGNQDSAAAAKRMMEARASEPEGIRTLKTTPRLTEVQQSLGIAFTYDNGASPERRIVETTGGGAGWLDLDADGLQDLFLVQAGNPLTTALSGNPSDRMFRNRNGSRFEEVSRQSGIDERRYGQGIAVGDFDGDGFDDIFITNAGPDTFYQNQGDGSFRDISDQLPVSSPAWGTSAAWADVDVDGDLDLFICNYLDYNADTPVKCVDADGNPRICHPSEVNPQTNQFLLNEGDGRFTDVLTERGLDGPGSKSLGLVIADLNQDHLPDIYVGNDTTANHLFINMGKGMFLERAVAAGCAANGVGQNQASMGVAFGDYDQDGLPDLCATHFTQEYNTLYRGIAGGNFIDSSLSTGLVHATMKFLGFGVVMTDFNSDGHCDMLVANGHIDESFTKAGDMFRMPAQLFSFNGRQWEECGSTAGDYFRKNRIGRAVATGDYDNDGDADVVVVNQNDETVVLQNSQNNGHWLKVNFVGSGGNRRGIGVEVSVVQNGRRLIQQLAAGTSFCASHQPALFFGLGESRTDCSVDIRWPDGKKQSLNGIRTDQSIVLQHRNAK